MEWFLDEDNIYGNACMNILNSATRFILFPHYLFSFFFHHFIQLAIVMRQIEMNPDFYLDCLSNCKSGRKWF